ncbi:MAG: hypothetical protein ACI4RU_06725 [Acutalibacteraceae bacterium]
MRGLTCYLVKNPETAGTLLYSDDDVSTQLEEFILSVEINQAGLLTVVLPRNHPQHGYPFRIIGTTVYIYMNNGVYPADEPFWAGRLFSSSINLYGEKTLIFEGFLSRLSTIKFLTNPSGKAAATTLGTNMTRILNIYRYGKSTGSDVTAGTLRFIRADLPERGLDTTVTFDLSELTEDDTLLSAMQHLITKYKSIVGGEYYIELTGVNWNRLNIRTVGSVQETIPPESVTDYSAASDGTIFANRVYALGAVINDEGDRLDITTSSSDLPYVERLSGDYGVQDVGVVAKTVIYDNVTSKSKLLACANRELTKAFKTEQSYSVEIVDKYAIVGDYSHYKIGEKVKFNSVDKLPGFTAIVTARTYDFLKPLNDRVTITQTKKKLTSQL